MGIFGDLTDAVKKRIQDPPKYRNRREECVTCSGSGVCQSCKGKPSEAGKYAAIAVGVIGLGLSLASCGTGAWGAGAGWFAGALALFTVINIAWHCQCQPSAFNADGGGKCTGCAGRGYNTVQERVGGTDILQAVQQTNEASRLTKEFGTASGGSLAEMEQKIDRALTLNPDHFGANAIKGVLPFDRGDHTLAICYLEKAEARKPSNIEIKEALCVVHEAVGDHEAAERKYAEAVALGVRSLNRKQMGRNVAAGVVGGLVGLFIPFLDE